MSYILFILTVIVSLYIFLFYQKSFGELEMKYPIKKKFMCWHNLFSWKASFRCYEIIEKDTIKKELLKDLKKIHIKLILLSLLWILLLMML